MDVFLHGVDWILGGAHGGPPSLCFMTSGICPAVTASGWEELHGPLTVSSGLDCPGLPGLRLPQFSDLELAIFDEGLSCIRPFLYSIPKCHFEKLIDNTQL